MERTEVDKGDVIEVKFNTEVYLLWLMIDNIQTNHGAFDLFINSMLEALSCYLDDFFLGRTPGDIKDSYTVFELEKDNKGGLAS